jgi:hypothetical protein
MFLYAMRIAQKVVAQKVGGSAKRNASRNDGEPPFCRERPGMHVGSTYRRG